MYKKLEKINAYFYFIFRVMVGLLFFQHGFQKLIGFGNEPMTTFIFMWFIGLIELLAGLGIAFGLFTRLSAIGGSFVVIGAYFKAHFPQGWIPIVNKGELALLFLACFLVVLTVGPGIWSLGRAIFGKEVL